MTHQNPQKVIILVLGIDTFRQKNLHQIACLESQFLFWIFQTGTSDVTISPPHRLQTMPRTAIPRLAYLVCTILKLKSQIHHAEIYPGGRFAVVYMLLCKLFRIKSIIVERGDLILYPSLGLIGKLSLRFSYLLATGIWFREYYMEKTLQKWSKTPLYFIPNAVPYPTHLSKGKPDITFLWANRIIPERKASWVAHAIQDQITPDAQYTILGMQGIDSQEAQLKELSTRQNLTLIPFSDPWPYYRQAKFFILPADIVFANYALLEAMSHGVVPIVSDVHGTDQIVQNGVNGIVFTHHEEGFTKALLYAYHMPSDVYQRLSDNARSTIKLSFSIDIYKKRLLEMYRGIATF